jgi:hypothetical protein
MEAREFENQLKAEITQLDFVENIDVSVEESVLDGRINLQYACYVKVYYRAEWLKFSFSLIVNNERKWGIDKDIINGWHRHSLENPKFHEPIAAQNITQIIAELKEVWVVMTNKSKV